MAVKFCVYKMPFVLRMCSKLNTMCKISLTCLQKKDLGEFLSQNPSVSQTNLLAVASYCQPSYAETSKSTWNDALIPLMKTTRGPTRNANNRKSIDGVSVCVSISEYFM